jgi:hypothetical protein
MLSDYQTLVTELVRDDAGKIAAAEKDRAIDLAVKRYSKDRPQVKVEDLTPESANLLPLPASWESDFSELRSLEYPIGDVPPTLIEPGRYEFYRSPTALKIQVLDAVAVAANNVRASYTIKHVVSASADTIPIQDREPVACWAAAILADELAAFYSGGTDSSVQADSVEQRSKAEEYAARARTLRKRYHDELGIEEKKAAPAGVVVNLDQPDSRGEDRLLHLRRYR